MLLVERLPCEDQGLHDVTRHALPPVLNDNSSDFGCQLSSPMVSSHTVRLHLPTSGVLSFRPKEADSLTGDAVSDRTKGPLFTRLTRRLILGNRG
jgi:hypothetical protein